MQQQDTAAGAPEFRHDASQSRYEAHLGGKMVAKAQYRVEGDRVVFIHTEVDGAYEGQGLASKLAAYALDDVRMQGRKAVPACSFIAGYIARHQKEYGDLVPR